MLRKDFVVSGQKAEQGHIQHARSVPVSGAEGLTVGKQVSAGRTTLRSTGTDYRGHGTGWYSMAASGEQSARGAALRGGGDVQEERMAHPICHTLTLALKHASVAARGQQWRAVSQVFGRYFGLWLVAQRRQVPAVTGPHTHTHIAAADRHANSSLWPPGAAWRR